MWDFAGWQDTGGPLQNIYNTFSNSKVFTKESAYRIVVVVDKDSCTMSKGDSVTKVAEMLCNLTSCNTGNEKNRFFENLIVVITKTDQYDETDYFDFLKNVSECSKLDAAKYMRFLKRENIMKFSVPDEDTKSLCEVGRVELLDQIFKVNESKIAKSGAILLDADTKIKITNFIAENCSNENKLFENAKLAISNWCEAKKIKAANVNNLKIVQYSAKELSNLKNKLLTALNVSFFEVFAVMTSKEFGIAIDPELTSTYFTFRVL